uniref:Uncharacterized protein n=1 Tax=Megaselia scalaris TaxID=36166 RepID=T1GLH8_MEGSC
MKWLSGCCTLFATGSYTPFLRSRPTFSFLIDGRKSSTDQIFKIGKSSKSPRVLRKSTTVRIEMNEFGMSDIKESGSQTRLEESSPEIEDRHHSAARDQMEKKRSG